MFKFTVFQFHMSREAANVVNAMGWDKARQIHPEVEIQREVKFFGSENFSAWMSEYFTPVAEITAKDLDDVFHIGNVGPAEKITRLAERMHSLSVGDVIRNDEDGTFHMVDDIGFTQLLSFTKEAA